MVIYCSACMAVWAAGTGDGLGSSDTAIEGLNAQLREQTGGAQQAAVAELVRTGHVSAALQVDQSAISAPVDFLSSTCFLAGAVFTGQHCCDGAIAES